MKKFVIFIVVALVGLYLFFQWKKKSNAKPVNTDIPQNTASTISNVTPIRQDVVTQQDLINNNASVVSGSSTSDNPVTRENPQPISLDEHLSEVTIAVSPGITIKPVLSNGGGLMVPNTPLTTSITTPTAITQIPDVVNLTDGRQLESFSPITPQQYRKDSINALLASTPSLKPLVPADILLLLAS